MHLRIHDEFVASNGKERDDYDRFRPRTNRYSQSIKGGFDLLEILYSYNYEYIFEFRHEI